MRAVGQTAGIDFAFKLRGDGSAIVVKAWSGRLVGSRSLDGLRRSRLGSTRRLETVFLHLVAQGVSANPQGPRCLRLIAVRLRERLYEQTLLVSLEGKIIHSLNRPG